MSECEGEHPFFWGGRRWGCQGAWWQGGRESRKLGTAGLSPQEEYGTEGFGSKGGKAGGPTADGLI